MTVLTETLPEYVSPYIGSAEQRMSEIVLGSALVTASAPIEGATSLLLRHVLDEGPVRFSQKRTGGLEVDKLRTMHLLPHEAPTQSVWESSGRQDPRIPTKWGLASLIRGTGADELPQLRQVVRGAWYHEQPRLHLVGLRPLIEMHADEMHDQIVDRGYTELARRWRELHEVGPKGVVSPAATYYKHRSSNTEIDPVMWARMEYGYCVNASARIEQDMLVYTFGKVASSLTQRLLGRRMLLRPA